MIGSTISRYRIVEKIGAGGMGEVYRAHDERLDRDVAIKVLPEAVARNRDRLARFEREAKAVARLSHPNILEIFDFGRAGDITFAVTELLEGETLRMRLDTGRLDWRHATEIGAAIADGIDAAHQAGIIHRDLKPSNIFLISDGRVKILDFGLARHEEPDFGEEKTQLPTITRNTQAGTVLGTVGYMSPEQLRGQAADSRTDIFALGCVLYEMVTGRCAFQRETPADTISAILSEEVLPISAVPEPPLAAYEHVVKRCLEKRPHDRYQAAREVAVALRTRHDAHGGAVVADETPATSIVVLPFANLSPDPENEYFADGLSGEIISDLSRIGSLRVISRTSAIRYKNTDKDVPTIGRELDVRYVLEGTVRKSANNLRITAQLIDSRTDAHLWSEKYAGTLDDVFDIQEKVSRSISSALEVKLSPAEEQSIVQRPIADGRAYECYLRARHEIDTFTEDGLDRAIHYLETGLKIMGDNPLLHAGLGYTYWQHANLGHEREYIDKAEECARKALELDPDNPKAHFLLGSLFFAFGGDQRRAKFHLERALALNPNDCETLCHLAVIYGFFVGRPLTAEPLVEKVLSIDPLNCLGHMVKALVQLSKGKIDLARESALNAYRVAPDNPAARFVGALFLAQASRLDDAFSLIEESEKAAPDNVFTHAGIFLKNALQGKRAEALQAMTPKLESWARRDSWNSWLIVQGYALIDRKEEALDWLENAVSLGAINYPLFNEHDPFLENIRGEERFKQLMKRVKYEWEHFEV